MIYILCFILAWLLCVSAALFVPSVILWAVWNHCIVPYFDFAQPLSYMTVVGIWLALSIIAGLFHKTVVVDKGEKKNGSN